MYRVLFDEDPTIAQRFLLTRSATARLFIVYFYKYFFGSILAAILVVLTMTLSVQADSLDVSPPALCRQCASHPNPIAAALVVSFLRQHTSWAEPTPGFA
jgi:hypothetical protein